MTNLNLAVIGYLIAAHWCCGASSLPTTTVSPTSKMGECGQSDDGRRQFEANTAKAQKCLESVKVSASQLDKTVDQYCDDGTKYAGCIDEFMKSQMHCFPSEKQAFMQTTANGFKAVAAEECNTLKKKKEAKEELMVIPSASMKCVVEKVQPLNFKACYESNTDLDFAILPTAIGFATAEFAKELLDWEYIPKECEDMVVYNQCAEKLFNECPGKPGEKLFKKLNDAFYSVTPCSKSGKRK